ncbi:BMC domain-containing protein [Leptolyngbya sp. FACHB-17]|uniref:carbon dioxide-concentrating mechanism protein n=1 Tax=unclassified Leptolyngbya TaxID=2650499 RepID=UPI0016811786|nr:BMC domain-containing protein [Leptolyngbya sp. FACHB-17]MBD2081148.1 BMC domain-containing protein [Leptolyngbya sp. FACHB-17]
MNRQDQFLNTALGLVSTQSFPAIVGTADMMLKSSGVTLVGYEMIGGGYCTAVVRGGISDVRLAVEVGAETVEQFGMKVSTVIIPRPMPNLDEVLPIGSKLAAMIGKHSTNQFSNLAVGLLETRGFPAMVAAADAMLKSADVTLTAYHTIGDGLCTAIIRGTVANVAMAVEVGMQEAERVGELHSVMVIPRALDDLDQTLPIATCWVEELQPLQIPITVKEVEKPLVALPELVELQPLELPAQVERALPQAQAAEFEPEEKEAIEIEQTIEPAEKQAIELEIEQSDEGDD